MKYLLIYELNSDQLKELKAKLYEEKHPEGVSMGEIAGADSLITDREIWERYRTTAFVPEDFASPSTADATRPLDAYRKSRATWQKESDDFLSKYAFFAFNDNQFKEGLQKFDCKEDDAKDRFAHLISGCYILKDKKQEYYELLKANQDKQAELMQNPFFAFGAFLFELNNHEYAYTMEIDDALDSLGLDYAEDIAPNEMLQAVLADAMEESAGTLKPSIAQAADTSAEDPDSQTETPGDIVLEMHKAATFSKIPGTLGSLAINSHVIHETTRSAVLFAEVKQAMQKYFAMDWGDTDNEDKPLNDAAANFPGTDRILAAYNTCAGVLFIITEYDRSATTVLFASDY